MTASTSMVQPLLLFAGASLTLLPLRLSLLVSLTLSLIPVVAVLVLASPLPTKHVLLY
jgi:hypothetical protein